MKEFFTRKYGPLPMWAWIGIGVAVLYVYEKYKGSTSTTSTTSTPGNQTAPPIYFMPLPGNSGAGGGGGSSNGGTTTVGTPITGRNTSSGTSTVTTNQPSSPAVPRTTVTSYPHKASGVGSTAPNWAKIIAPKPNTVRKWNPSTGAWYYLPASSGVKTIASSMPHAPAVSRVAKVSSPHAASTPSAPVRVGTINKLKAANIVKPVTVARPIPSPAVKTGVANKIAANPRMAF